MVAVLGVAACAVLAAPTAASAQEASTPLGSYSVAAQAPVMQVLQDADNASFHPQGEGELTYAEADMDQSKAHALASVFWPGGAAGNLGSLLAVLGYQGLGALNDPARTEVTSGAGPTEQNLGSGPTTMSSSVKPSSGNTQEATAETHTAQASGTGGSGTALVAMSLGQDGTLKETATSSATGVSIGGVIDIGSFSSSAALTSTNAGTPTGSNGIKAGHFTIGGQTACLDGSGVHAGACGQQASPAAVAAANQALKAAGMQIYFTEPHQVRIAYTTYDYAASMIVYWAPPGDVEHDTFTITLGGAAVAMHVTAGSGLPGLPADLAPFSPVGSGGGGAATIPANQAAPTLALPTGVTGGTAPTLATTRTPSSRRATGNPQVALNPISVASSHGIGAGWIVLLLIAAVLGAVGLPRLPALLSAAARPVCPEEAAHRRTGRK
jgi:hypothetical protein